MNGKKERMIERKYKKRKKSVIKRGKTRDKLYQS